MIRSSANDPNFNPAFYVPTGETVDNEDFVSAVEVINSSLAIGIKGFFRQFNVDVSPPNIVDAIRRFDNAFVFWTATCFGGRTRNQSSSGRNSSRIVFQRFLIKNGGNGVADNSGSGDAQRTKVKFDGHFRVNSSLMGLLKEP